MLLVNAIAAMETFLVPPSLEVIEDFFSNWPILAIPLAGLIYLPLNRTCVENSVIAAIVALSIPGVLLALLAVPWNGDIFDLGFFVMSILFMPSNLVAPISLIYGIFVI